MKLPLIIVLLYFFNYKGDAGTPDFLSRGDFIVTQFHPSIQINAIYFLI
jgi:hypothetical protein